MFLQTLQTADWTSTCCDLGWLSGGFRASLPCGSSSWRINLAYLKCFLPALQGLYLLLCLSLSLWGGDEFLCWGFGLAGGSSCWVAGAVLAQQCAGAHLLPTPSIWALAAALHLRSFLPGTWEREMLSSRRLSALCSTLPKSLHALSPWEESLLGSVFNKFNPRVQTLLLSVGLILRGVSAAIPPRAGA